MEVVAAKNVFVCNIYIVMHFSKTQELHGIGIGLREDNSSHYTERYTSIDHTLPLETEVTIPDEDYLPSTASHRSFRSLAESRQIRQ